MANFYNPYSVYPQSFSYAPVPQNFYNQQNPQQQNNEMIKWVEGEVGAKAFQMPQGLPANQPIPLWDSTDTNIFLKSWGPMGIPNPIQKLHYTMEQTQTQQYLQSGNQEPQAHMDMSQYVTKDELNQIRTELRDALSGASRVSMNGSFSGSQNGNQNNQNGNNGNRGGNK